jgi:hypothetical protein
MDKKDTEIDTRRIYCKDGQEEHVDGQEGHDDFVDFKMIDLVERYCRTRFFQNFLLCCLHPAFLRLGYLVHFETEKIYCAFHLPSSWDISLFFNYFAVKCS